MVRPPTTQSADRARGGLARAETGVSRGPLIRVSTRCGSIDELVAKFAGFASEGALVLPAAGELPIGTEGRFVIRLLDQSVAMRGRCRVLDVKPVPAGPPIDGARRALLRVALLDLEEASRQVHARLMAHRRQAVPIAVTGGESEATIVSPSGWPTSPASSVPPPPIRQPPPPPPVASQMRTIIGVAPAAGDMGPPPPVNPLARTMIGPLTAGGSAAGSATAKTSAAPAVEKRVPGAAYTLPANPLGALQAEDLASFIDSTLFEVDDDEATAERPAPPPAEIDVPIEEMAVASAAPATGAAPGRSEAPGRNDAGAVIAAPVAIAGTEPTSLIAKRAPATGRSATRRLLVPAGCLAIGLAIGHLWLSPGKKAAPAPPRDDRPAPAPVVLAMPASPEPAATVPAVIEAAKAVPAVIEAAKAVPTAAKTATATTASAIGQCTARIVTEPAEAKIVWGGKPLGSSPIAHARIPCGSATVVIEHERYQPVTQTLTAEPGAPVAVSQRLRRPPGTLVVTSTPPHAYITVNEQVLGPAPRRLASSRYEQVSIRATYPGYQPWTKKIYLKEPTTDVAAQLVPSGHAAFAR